MNPYINAVVDERYRAALDDAREVDRMISEARVNGEIEKLFSEKPLLGIPFTVKESCSLAGDFIIYYNITMCSHFTNLSIFFIKKMTYSKKRQYLVQPVNSSMITNIKKIQSNFNPPFLTKSVNKEV